MIKKGAVTGLLLFGIFFGAGNLIFPPALGVQSGEFFWQAISGFILSGVGLAVVTLIIGTLNPKGYFFEMASKISPVFAMAFLSAIYLTIGPFFAIPRTASTAFNVGILPMIHNLPIQILGIQMDLGVLLFTVIYFGSAYLLSLNPSKLLNRIGQILTPLFAILIILLIVFGVMTYGTQPSGMASTAYQSGKAFGTGFIEGYNTLDALAAVAFSMLAVKTLKQLGFTSKKEYMTTIWVLGAVVAIAFSALYIGLAFLGNKFPMPTDSVVPNVGVYVLSQATQAIFGQGAQLFLAIMVLFTCFTTTVGLIVATSEFFYDNQPKIQYKTYVSVFTGIGFLIANLGLHTIITYSVPVLLFLYPITISLVLIIIVNKFLPLSKLGMQLTIGVVSLIAAMMVTSRVAGLFLAPEAVMASAFVSGIDTLLNGLPFYDASVPWLVPAIIGIILSLVLPHKIKGDTLDM